MDVQRLIERKRELKLSMREISERSGVPFGTVQKIFGGETKSPRYETLKAISDVLFGEGFFDEYLYMDKYSYNNSSETNDELHDGAAAYSVTRHFRKEGRIITNPTGKTIEDYLALPEGTRIELIDGVFYDMAAPTMIHQKLVLEIGVLFTDHVNRNNGNCVPFVSPVDVQIDSDDKTMVQPDIFIVCDRNKITRNRLVGAPDLIVEVVSPSNVFMDVAIKMMKYKSSGVREYWLVFPEEKRILVYEFEKSNIPVCYSFEDTVPVGIWDGECKIDFKDIYKKIEFMY